MNVVKEVVAAYVLGDTPDLLEFTHPEAVFRFPGDPSVLSWAGSYVGAEIQRFHEHVKDCIDMLEYVVHTLEPAGDKVLVFARERCRVRGTKKLFVNEHVGIATVRGGKLVRYREYADTARMEAAFLE